MARVCLPKKERDQIIDAFKSGKITLEDLYSMNSADRRSKFASLVGDDLATVVNARFEQAMLSKQKDAMVKFIKATTTAKDPVRRDMLKRVERVKEALTSSEERGFLTDLAEQKLGIAVTEEEAKTIIDLKKTVDNLRDAIPENSPINSLERIEYGLALDRFKNYVGELKLRADSLSTKERFDPKNLGRNVVDFAGFTKSLVATLDNSFIGRQGIKVLLRGNYKIWFKTFAKSFELFGKEMMSKAPKGFFKDRDDAVMSALRASIFSRPNALNGKYRAAKNGYGLGLLAEEAFPSSIPAKIPFLGRVFKASETAFNGSAIYMRAELADAMIAAAEKNGIDMLDEKQASAIGSLVGSMTGRGELTTFAAAGREINALMFAPRFLKANWNTLTAHTFDKTMTPYARKQAALATLKIASSIGAVLAMAEITQPGSVEWDPRSSEFGMIKIGDKKYDITGGMKGLITLASRLVPTLHNGEWGRWTKNAKTGAYTKLSQGEFGGQNTLDVFQQFFEGKLSPSFAQLRDWMKGQTFSGEKPSIVNTISGLTVPISLQILEEEVKKGNDELLLAMILEGLGLSSTDSTLRLTGPKWQALEEKVGVREMNQAMREVTERFNARADRLRESNQWERMTNEQQKEALDEIKREVTNTVLGAYGIN